MVAPIVEVDIWEDLNDDTIEVDTVVDGVDDTNHFCKSRFIVVAEEGIETEKMN